MFSPFCSRSFALLAGVTLSCLATTQPTFAVVVTDPVLPQQMDSGPRAPLSAIDYSTDGKTLVSIATDGEIRWRDVQTGKTVFKATLPQPSRRVKTLPDGSFLTRGQDATLTWWEAPNNTPQLKLRREISAPKQLLQYSEEALATAKANQKPNIPAAQFSISQVLTGAGGNNLAVVYQEELPGWGKEIAQRAARIVLFNTNDGSVLRELPLITFNSTRPVVSFSDAGKTLLIVQPDHSVQWHNVATGKQIKNWQPPETAVQSPDDGAEEEARRLQTLPPHLREGRRRPPNRRDQMAQDLQSPEKKFGTPLLFSPDGKLLLSSTLAGYKVWDLATSTPRVLEKSVRLGRATPSFSPDSSLIAFYTSGGIWAWDTAGKQRGFTSIQFTEFSDLTFSNDGRTVATSDDMGQVRLWNMTEATGPKLQKILPGFVSPLRSVLTLKDGVLCVTQDALLRIPATGEPQWFNLPLMQTPEAIPSATRQVLDDVAVSPDGTLLAEAVALSPYYSTLETKGFARGEVRVRDAKTGAVLWRISDTDKYRSASLAWLSDNSLLTGKEGGGGIRLRGTSNDSELEGLQRRDGKTGEYQTIDVEWANKNGASEPGSIGALVTAKSAPRLALVSGYMMQIIDLKTGKVLRARDQMRSREYLYALSPDGRWLAAGHNEGAVLLWDANRETQDVYARADFTLLPSSKESIGVKAMAFGKDGSLATGMKDGRVLLWQQPFTKEAAPAWETAANGASITALNFDEGGKLWIGNSRGEVHTRNSKTGELQSVLTLTPPTSTVQDATPGWIRWNHAGTTEKSP